MEMTMKDCIKEEKVALSETIPRRPFGSTLNNENLPENVSIISLGCSSFSTFFMNQNDRSGGDWTVDRLDQDNPHVRSWIDTIEYAICTAGITILDTAPWYGHGISEVVVGWALEKILESGNRKREQLTINTKVGRYEADPNRQFDFSSEATLRSVEQSIRRLRCGSYIDVLQLHDPEFAPSIDLLFEETIPAMKECQAKGWCRALGMTGYPLSVQHQILERSLQQFGENIWDQALVYSHYNLHDTSLLHQPIHGNLSFLDYCRNRQVLVLSAAPLSMGLLTRAGPPEWHPASIELKEACQLAADICHRNDVDISTIALLFALTNPKIPTTVLGMSCIQEVKAVHSIALRCKDSNLLELSHDEILRNVLSDSEKKALDLIEDPISGPYSKLWRDGSYQWNGIHIAQEFWKLLPNRSVIQWQKSQYN